MISSLLNKHDGSQAARKLQQKLCTPQGKSSLYGLVFPGLDTARRKDSSYFLSSDIFISTDLRVPQKGHVQKYDSGKGLSLASRGMVILNDEHIKPFTTKRKNIAGKKICLFVVKGFK